MRSRLQAPIIVLSGLLLALVIGCGDWMFSSDPSLKVLGISSLSVQWATVPDSIRIGDSSLISIRLLNQENADVTMLMDTILWHVQPTTVATLSAGNTPATDQRTLRGRAVGEASVSVEAYFTKSNGKIVRTPPTVRFVAVSP